VIVVVFGYEGEKVGKEKTQKRGGGVWGGGGGGGRGGDRERSWR